MEKERPLLVVLTPVLNEAWILPAFLKATSLWADHIIIADQMSTDGSRKLYKQFSKVTVVDNPRKEMHQAQTRRLLFDAAKKIEGDKILFALDADEFLAGNFPETEGWRTIINSEPGDVFCFKWMNLKQGGRKCTIEPEDYYYWAAHVNDNVMNGTFPDNFIHEWRLPWPTQERHVYKLDDIRFIHFVAINTKRMHNKRLFYCVSQYSHPSNHRGGVYFGRFYSSYKDTFEYHDVPTDAYIYYELHGLNLWTEMNFKDEGPHYVQSVLNIIQEVGASTFKKLDIWNEDVLKEHNIIDPRGPIDKVIHWYIRTTREISDTLFIRGIDYFLKKIY